MSPILNLLSHITLLLMVLTCPSTHHPINIVSILGIREKIASSHQQMSNWWANKESQVIYMNPNTSGISLRKTSSPRTTCSARGGCTFWTDWDFISSDKGKIEQKSGDDQKYHDPCLHMLQTKAQESPWHHIQTHTHFPDNHMDSFKVSLVSRNLRVGKIPTSPHPPSLSFPELTTRRYQTILTLLCGTCSRTQVTIIP